jgi:hypothetical protein
VSTRTTDLGFYLARAAQARDEAEAATLEHVRERCRRSEAAWNALAARADRTSRMKAEEEMRKAAGPPKAEDEIDNCKDGRTGPQDPEPSAPDARDR